MKKTLSIIVLTVLAATASLKAQYYRIDPFAAGEKYLGVEVGIGGWLGQSQCTLTTNDYGAYSGYTADNLKRDPFNPTVALIYKRTIEQRNINLGTSFRLAFNWWHGSVEGSATANPANTFTTKFKYTNIEISDLYYLMFPVGDQISINAGFGLTLGLNRDPSSTIEFSNGTPTVETKVGLDFMDLLSAQIDLMVGVDYLLTDDITLSANIIGYPIDFFGMMDDENVKGFRGIGEGLYVSKKFPYQLTIGITYHL